MSNLYESDSDPEFQPKRIKVDESLQEMPGTSSVKTPSLQYSSESIYDEDVLDDNEYEQSFVSDSDPELEPKHISDSDPELELEPKDIKIDELLQKMPRKSCMKKSAFQYPSQSEDATTSKCQSDDDIDSDEDEGTPYTVSDEKCVIKERNGKVLADFTGIFKPEDVNDEDWDKIEKRRDELGPLFPPKSSNSSIRKDVYARYNLVKKYMAEDDYSHWHGSHSDRLSVNILAKRKRINAANIRNYFSKENYHKSLKE